MATSQLARPQQGPVRLRGTPVFLYHGLTGFPSDGPRRERKYWVAASQLCKHLECLSTEVCQVVLLRELRDFRDVSKRENPLTVLTFDDGVSSQYEMAFPLLLETAMRAEFFVNTAHVGTKGFLSWQQIAEMQRAGMSFQSHSHDHVDLVKLPLLEKQEQLKRSKQMLEDKLGREVEFLAVPFGRLSREVFRVAIETGYRAVCTSRSWPARRGALLVNRVVVYRHTSQYAFRELLMGNPASYAIRAARAAALFFPKHVRSHFPVQKHATGLENLI